MTDYLVRPARGRVWRRARWALALPAIAFALWACTDHPLSQPSPVPVTENRQLRDVNPIRDVDILFVVDNSGSMAEEQANLARNFPAFMQELKNIPGGLPNVRIAVVTSDLGGGASTARTTCPTAGGDKAQFFNARGVNLAGCGLDLTQHRFLEASSGGTQKNYTGEIEAVFSCLAKVGTMGCSFEHSLQAARLALTNPDNKGFLRDHAYLALVVITDEDDCSAPASSDLFAQATPNEEWSFRCARAGHLCGADAPPAGDFGVPLASCQSNEKGKLIPVAEMVKAIVDLKKDPNKVLVSGIFGWPLPNDVMGAEYRVSRTGQEFGVQAICSSAGNGSAAPGVRVNQFVQSFPNRTVHSICEGDFRPAMQQIGQRIGGLVGPPCVAAKLADSKPGTKEFDPECVVEESVPGGARKVYGRCKAGGTRPCWDLTADTTCSASGYRIDIDRAGQMPAPGTQQTFRCLTETVK